MSIRRAAICVIALSLAGCAEPVRPIQVWSPQTAAQASIGSIFITNSAPQVPEDAIAALQAALEAKLAQCATGPTKYEMLVRVDNFKLANTGMVMLVGDSHEVAAEVKFVRPEDKSVAAEYYVQERTSGGGLIGLAKLSGGSRAISTDFAKSVCEKVFKKG
ncbi:MAG: hypothetical protein LCH95_02880 [Proteobacteria bacterium]|nr:hypothetical protein [Pseudomonadota bacterium]